MRRNLGISTALNRGGFLFFAVAFLTGAAPAEAGQPIGPTDVVASPDQAHLYVVESDAERIDIVEIATTHIVRSIACPARPNGIAVSSDGKTLYVPCGGPQGRVCVVESATGKITTTIRVGHTPCSPTLLPDGKRLFVCNSLGDDISVIDVPTGKEIARVPAIREPVASAATPDGEFIFVANLLPVGASDANDVAAEVTIIESADLKTSAVRLPNGSSSVRGVCVSPDGKYAYVVHILSRYRMPTTQLERGWMNTNAMSVIDVAGKKLLNTVLLDDIDLGAANPWSVAATADGRWIVVTHAGSHELSVVDAGGLLDKLHNMPQDLEEAKAKGRYDTQGTYSSTTVEDVPNDLAFLVDVRHRIPLRKGRPWERVGNEDRTVRGPRGFDIVGSKAYVAAYFSDVLAVVDLVDTSYGRVEFLELGPEPKMTAVRRGEMHFHDATLCFQTWQSCSSCHPNARVDALNWDLMNDGLGNPKNAKSMLLSHSTPPVMSSGIRGTAEEAVRAEIRHIQFAVHPDAIALAIDAYLKALEPVPSPHLVDGKLTDAAARGEKLFFSERVGCATCHPKPLYTDLKMHDVGSKGPHDRRQEFDTPTVIEVWRTAPYMHDGHFATVKELLHDGKHGKYGGDVEGLTSDELDDLVEFVLSL